MSKAWQAAIGRAREHAPFLALALDRQPALEALLDRGKGEEALLWAKAAGADAPDVATALRRERLGLAAAIPAVVIYNHFSRRIAAHRALVADTSAAVLRLVSRDLGRH